MTVNSNNFTERRCPREGSPISRKMRTSLAVMRTAAHSGRVGKSRQRPMADPSNSAKSVLIIAISQSAYNGYSTLYRIRRRYFGLSCRSNLQCDAKSACELVSSELLEDTKAIDIPEPVTQPSLNDNDYLVMSVMFL